MSTIIEEKYVKIANKLLEIEIKRMKRLMELFKTCHVQNVAPSIFTTNSSNVSSTYFDISKTVQAKSFFSPATMTDEEAQNVVIKKIFILRDRQIKSDDSRIRGKGRSKITTANAISAMNSLVYKGYGQIRKISTRGPGKWELNLYDFKKWTNATRIQAHNMYMTELGMPSDLMIVNRMFSFCKELSITSQFLLALCPPISLTDSLVFFD